MGAFKKKVCAYCRVSTDRGDQSNSFEAQRRFFEEYINSREGWCLSGIYCDEGISGTSVRGRSGFMNMIRAAEAGEVDVIITKEISRFARNTLDSIYYTRELRNLGVGVVFLSDGINTLDADSELRLTIMASVAQEESRRTSERVRWGQRRQMERGIVFGREPMGYRLCGGVLTVDSERAETVLQIFRWYTEEEIGTYAIAKRLNSLSVKPPGVAEKWSSATVARILKNEKYCGDLIQQKTYTPDYLTHAKRINRGEAEFVTIRDHHEAIVPRHIFDKAQARLEKNGGVSGGRFPLSGKVICGLCGAKYTSKFKKLRSGGYRLWRCSASCGNPSVRDSILRYRAEEAICSFDLTHVINEAAELLRQHGAEVSHSDILSLFKSPMCDDILRYALKEITFDRGDIKVYLWEG